MNVRRHLSLLAICLLALAFSAASAHADVTYTFSGTNSGLGGDGSTVGFQYTSASFLSSFTSVLQSQLNSCTNCQNSAYPDVYFAPGTIFGDGLGFNDKYGNTGVFIFATGAFSAIGTYYSGGVFGAGTLTVSTVAVPEPSSLFMVLLTGAFMGLLFWAHQKSASKKSLQLNCC